MKNYLYIILKISLINLLLFPSIIIGLIISPSFGIITSILSLYYGWSYINNIDSITQNFSKISKNKLLNDIIKPIKTMLLPLVNLFSGERKIMINKEEQFFHDVFRWIGPITIIGFAIFILFSDAKNLPIWFLIFIFLGLIFIFKSAVNIGFEKSNDEKYDKKINKKLKDWSIKDTLFNTPIMRIFRSISGKESTEEIFNPITSQLKKKKTDQNSDKKGDENLFCGNCGRKRSKFSIKFCTTCGNEFKNLD